MTHEWRARLCGIVAFCLVCVMAVALVMQLATDFFYPTWFWIFMTVCLVGNIWGYHYSETRSDV